MKQARVGTPVVSQYSVRSKNYLEKRDKKRDGDKDLRARIKITLRREIRREMDLRDRIKITLRREIRREMDLRARIKNYFEKRDEKREMETKIQRE